MKDLGKQLGAIPESMIEALPRAMVMSMHNALRVLAQTAVGKYMVRSSGGGPVHPTMLSWRAGKLVREVLREDDPQTRSVRVAGSKYSGIFGASLGRVPYARIHELGGVIIPKKAKVLAWVTSGERPTTPEGWIAARQEGRAVYAKRVVMPKRPYLGSTLSDKPTMAGIREMFAANVPSVLADSVRQRVMQLSERLN